MPSSSKDDNIVFKRILVGTDGSVNAKRALQVAIDLARRMGSELFIAYAIAQPVPPVSIPAAPTLPPEGYAPFLEDYYKSSREQARRLIADSVDLAKRTGISARGEVLDAPESVVEQLVDLAKTTKADLMVVGTRGLSGFRKLILGSVSTALVSHAPCAVLVVR